MRTLASLQQIEEIKEHTNADTLELAKILGWQCVVKKGEFKPGDLVCYFEIDSVLPDGPEWSEFMRPRNFRVKTIKLRGELSQGLVFPTSIIPDDDTQTTNYVGKDVTEILGVTKWDPPEVSGTRGAKSKGGFPAYIHKTDETRLQGVPTVLNELRGKTCYITTKMDGTSATFSYLKAKAGYYGEHEKDEFLVCSRNRALQDGDNIWWKIAHKYNLEEGLKALKEGHGWNCAFQGEICGPGIQKNKMGLKEIEFFAYQIYNIDTRSYLNFDKFHQMCNDWNIKTVPINDDNYTITEEDTVDSFIEMAKGTYDNGYPREGIVVRPVEEQFSNRLHGRCSFKVINNDFLLKEK